MNISRPLLAVSSALVAAAIAMACSSSSSSGGSVSSNCVSLAACCASTSFPAAEVSACEAVATGGNDSACASDLAKAQAAKACGNTTSDSGTGTNPGSSTGSGSSIGSSGTGTGSSGTGTGSSGTGSSSGSGTTPSSCTPHALPSTFTATAELSPAPTCTASQTVGAADCFVANTDAGIGLCQAAIVNGDAGLNACGQCVISKYTGSNWGAFIAILPPTAVGATTTTELDLFDVGSCVARLDTSATGQACATALNELNACEFAACVPYCPVASQMDTAGSNALLGTQNAAGCLGNADNNICTSYVMKADSACATEANDAGTGAIDICNKAITAANAATAASPAGLENYIGIFCGGADGGY